MQKRADDPNPKMPDEASNEPLGETTDRSVAQSKAGELVESAAVEDEQADPKTEAELEENTEEGMLWAEAVPGDPEASTKTPVHALGVAGTDPTEAPTDTEVLDQELAGEDTLEREVLEQASGGQSEFAAPSATEQPSVTRSSPEPTIESLRSAAGSRGQAADAKGAALGGPQSLATSGSSDPIAGPEDAATLEAGLTSDGVEPEETSMARARDGAQIDQLLRSGTSSTLEAHRVLQRQTALTPVPSGTTVAEAGKQSADPSSPLMAKAEGELSVERMARQDGLGATVSVPFTGATQAQVARQPALGDLRNTATTGSGTGTSQAAATGTVLTSASAVVTSVFGASDAGMSSEEGMLQRGTENFALPQLLAEASVRSGAASFRAETPRLVAQQLAEAVATQGKRNVDISLNPRELGQVSMRISTTETGVTVVIQAERAETEDLMRRNIQDLAREFRQMGFTDINFRFGSEGQQGQSSTDSGQQGGKSLSGSGEAAEEADSSLPLVQQLNVAADGLDMRI